MISPYTTFDNSSEMARGCLYELTMFRANDCDFAMSGLVIDQGVIIPIAMGFVG